MKPASTLVALGSLAALAALLSSCSTPGAPSSGQAAPTQWKEVSRIIGGNVVEYRVPVNAKVNDNVDQYPFVPDQPAPKTAAVGTTVTAGTASRSPPPAPPVSLDVSPAALPWAQSPAPTGSGPTEVAQAGPAGAAALGISQEAETALGRAEIAVRDAQSRFETAQAALRRAREAARRGDSASAVKLANTATALAQPAR